MPSPRVSIALPVFNGEEFVADTIKSILRQDYQYFELVITDNASTDGTEAICRRLSTLDPRVRYIRNERNLGAGPNFNIGFEITSGEYFKWCAHDDLMSSNFLSACVRALDTNGDAVLAYGTTLEIDSHGQLVRTARPTALNVEGRGTVGRFRTVLAESGTCYEVFGLFRRDALRRSSLHRMYYGSDLALLAEMALLGRFVHVPEVTFYNREHPGRSINIADKRMRVTWFNTNNEGKRSFEHWSLLGHLLEMAIRHRHAASLQRTLPSVLAWASHPVQLSRYALELVGAVSPIAQRSLRAAGLKFAGALQGSARLMRGRKA